jgi:hypothetical protein
VTLRSMSKSVLRVARDALTTGEAALAPRRVLAKLEWHQGELYPCVGFIVTNLKRLAEGGVPGRTKAHELERLLPRACKANRPRPPSMSERRTGQTTLAIH